MDFNFQAMIQAIIYSVHYLGTTLEVSFAALVIGVALGLVIALLWHQAQRIDWQAVASALWTLPAHTVGLAAGLALAGHALYGSLDLAGRHTTGHGLSTVRVHAVGMTSYAFTLSLLLARPVHGLEALLGSGSFRTEHAVMLVVAMHQGLRNGIGLGGVQSLRKHGGPVAPDK